MQYINLRGVHVLCMSACKLCLCEGLYSRLDYLSSLENDIAEQSRRKNGSRVIDDCRNNMLREIES